MMGPWGQHYERTETWWEQTPEWHRYLARCQFLLRQGLFVADICYLQPERPAARPFEAHPRRGYDYDECVAEVVLNRMSVKDGRITLPDGMSYRLLVLPQTGRMTPPLLRKIKELAQAGATIAGPPPQASPSLSGFPECDLEVRALARQIWGESDVNQPAERRLGSGRVFRQREPEKILGDLGVAPDFTSGEPLRYNHRHADGTDIYFVANGAPRRVITTGTFRVAGKVPELWWPDTGKLEQAAVFQESNGRTGVGLTLDPHGSVFLIFRKPLAGAVAVTTLLHDGERVFSAHPGSQLQVRIERATYGVPGSPDRTRDVRQKVQQKVDAGQRSFQVLTLAEGDNPAPEVVKTLVVDYVIGGNHYTVKGLDPATVHLTGDGVGLVVEKARYGVLDDPKRTRDVRDKLQRLLDAGESSFPVARMAEGDDPAYLVVKTLEVEYTLDGKRMTAHGTDPEVIELRPLAAEKELVAELHATSARARALQAFKPGKYEVELGDGTRRQLRRGRNPQGAGSQRPVVGAVHARLGRAGAGHVRETRLLERPGRPGDQVLFRHGGLQRRLRAAPDAAQRGPAAIPGFGPGRGHGGGEGQRPAIPLAVEAALSAGCHRRGPGWAKHHRGHGRQSLAQPADRRRATARRQRAQSERHTQALAAVAAGRQAQPDRPLHVLDVAFVEEERPTVGFRSARPGETDPGAAIRVQGLIGRQ